MLVPPALAKQTAVFQPSLVKECFSSVHYLFKDTALFLNTKYFCNKRYPLKS